MAESPSSLHRAARQRTADDHCWWAWARDRQGAAHKRGPGTPDDLADEGVGAHLGSQRQSAGLQRLGRQRVTCRAAHPDELVHGGASHVVRDNHRAGHLRRARPQRPCRWALACRWLARVVRAVRSEPWLGLEPGQLAATHLADIPAARAAITSSHQAVPQPLRSSRGGSGASASCGPVRTPGTSHKWSCRAPWPSLRAARPGPPLPARLRPSLLPGSRLPLSADQLRRELGCQAGCIRAQQRQHSRPLTLLPNLPAQLLPASVDHPGPGMTCESPR